MEIAARHIRFLRDNKVCDGVHVMAIGKEEIVPEILEHGRRDRIASARWLREP